LTGKSIRAFHIKIDNTNDTFAVPNGAGGVLFPEVWRKKDGKEVLFNVAAGGAGIASQARFWSYVYPKTPGFPSPYFLGKAFENRQPDPDPKDWEKIPAETGLVGKFPVDRFPIEYRDIRTYGDSAQAGTLIISDDDVLWMNPDATELRVVRFTHTIPSGVNRVTVAATEDRGEAFVLWKNGEEVLRLPAKQLDFWPGNFLGSGSH
jgi:hypothetical protein